MHNTRSTDPRREALTSLLAHITYRLLTRQKLPQSSQHSLDVTPTETLVTIEHAQLHSLKGDLQCQRD